MMFQPAALRPSLAVTESQQRIKLLREACCQLLQSMKSAENPRLVLKQAAKHAWPFSPTRQSLIRLRCAPMQQMS